MRQRIILNKQGLYVDCIIQDGRVSFEFEKGLEILNDKVEIYKVGDVTYGLLGLKRFIKIAQGQITLENNVTTTEIRILCALAYRIDRLINEGDTDAHTFFSEFNKIKKELDSLPRGWNSVQQHHIELHTHLIEILNPDEFLLFLEQYHVTYPINTSTGELDFESNNVTWLTYSDIKANNDIYRKVTNALRLDVSKQSEFSDLTNVVNNNRRRLLEIAEKQNAKYILKDRMSEFEREPDKTKRDCMVRDILYDDLLVASLAKLKDEEIEYSEISFSTANRLKYMSKKHSKDKSFNLLLSIRRDKDIKSFRRAARDLEELLGTSKVIGADVMGLEKELTGDELANFKNSLTCIIPVLHMYPNSLLRLHASEFKDAKNNLFESLKTIQEIQDELNKSCQSLFKQDWGKIPPPRIRVGHGVNILQNPELVDLLKDLDVTVEINVSSNYALGNIDSLNDVPISFYKKNGIKHVISTDGGGVYTTDIHQEENLLKEDTKESIEESKDPETKKTSEGIQTDLGRKGVGKPKLSDEELYKKLKPHLNKMIVEVKPQSLDEAQLKEKEKQGNMTLSQFVSYEMENLEGYIMDMDPDYDRMYYRVMIRRINELNNSGKSDIARTYLFFLQKELFPERQTAFIALQYMYEKTTNNTNVDNDSTMNYNKMGINIKQNNIIDSEIIKSYDDNMNLDEKFSSELIKLYEVIKASYEYERGIIKRRIQEQSDSEIKRR